MACAILERTSGLEPSSFVIIDYYNKCGCQICISLQKYKAGNHVVLMKGFTESRGGVRTKHVRTHSDITMSIL